MEFDLENVISLVPAGRREAFEHPPIVSLSNHHQENEEAVWNVGFSC
jgi:hypothetical protein